MVVESRVLDFTESIYTLVLWTGMDRAHNGEKIILPPEMIHERRLVDTEIVLKLGYKVFRGTVVRDNKELLRIEWYDQDGLWCYCHIPRGPVSKIRCLSECDLSQ